MYFRYDADQKVDAEVWDALDQAERMWAVLRFHRMRRSKLSGIKIHVAMHVTVEDRIALGDDDPVNRALARLMQEGLGRHDAIHAIGGTLMKCLYLESKGREEEADLEKRFFRELRNLNGRRWLREFRPLTLAEAEETGISGLIQRRKPPSQNRRFTKS